MEQVEVTCAEKKEPYVLPLQKSARYVDQTERGRETLCREAATTNKEIGLLSRRRGKDKSKPENEGEQAWLRQNQKL